MAELIEIDFIVDFLPNQMQQLKSNYIYIYIFPPHPLMKRFSWQQYEEGAAVQTPLSIPSTSSLD